MNGMVELDRRQVGQSVSRMSHVYRRLSSPPLPVVHFPPQLVVFPQSVGGLSVCVSRPLLPVPACISMTVPEALNSTIGYNWLIPIRLSINENISKVASFMHFSLSVGLICLWSTVGW